MKRRFAISSSPGNLALRKRNSKDTPGIKRAKGDLHHETARTTGSVSGPRMSAAKMPAAAIPAQTNNAV